MQPEDAVLSLIEAKQALKPGGRVVVTMPHDSRGAPVGVSKLYAKGITAYHHSFISRMELLSWFEKGRAKSG